MKTLNILLYFTVISILPGLVSAQDTTGMDMKVYSQYAGYSFFVLVLVIFSVFIYYTCHYKEKPVEEEEVFQTVVELKPANINILNSGFLKSLNLMYILLLVLVLIYLVIILTSII